jgi:hypothetical protein
MFGRDWHPGSFAAGAKAALLAACIGVGLSTASAVAQTQSPSTINPANPQDRTLTNPQDMTAPLAINPQSRQGPAAPVSPGSNGSYVSPGTSVGPGVTGFDPYNAKLNAQLGGPIPPGSTTMEAALA